MNTLNTATFFIKPDAPNAIDTAKRIYKKLTASNINCLLAVSSHCSDLLPEFTHVDASDIPEENNIAVALGGDGTYLTAAFHLYGKSVPLVGINSGRLGFLAEFDAEETSMSKLFGGATNETLRPYFHATVCRGDTCFIVDEPFLNDAVIQRHAIDKMLEFSINVREKFVTKTRADGMIISTPTGSTAYNLSSGGPIVHPQLEALILSPICPHTLSFRPVVIPPKEVTVTVDSDSAILSLDGREGINLEVGDKIVIKQSGTDLRQLESLEYNFFDLLRHKFGWDNK